ncbi:hypothetical protein JG687_00014358 [Phytophthora cactorum]|uniref:Uncharacterized protein n=1 Tax=Phytophthora cactorum TaxID=29920 RepID=A0A8T1TYZ4_9STRA|nr:hypothetical protein PC120_g6504 [Phytophthora cactorum]KAG3065521.1 hypothetical protein PC121_g11324 [Phytophthora cactorum]KAG4049637.1 hypothetical protein PC123_g15096 [Phytophthora cactorum]KAG6950274.1 hypothetical protein JG687_00014358 [Phytophthora cactorum]
MTGKAFSKLLKFMERAEQSSESGCNRKNTYFKALSLYQTSNKTKTAFEFTGAFKNTGQSG